MGRSEGATFFMVLLAVFQTLLGRYSGQEDVIVGSPISGRTRPEASDLIGFFVNTLVFRTNLAGNPTFRELLRRVREVCLGAYRHQELPFERLVEEIQPERDLSRTPIYQAMLVFTVNMVGRHEHMGEVKWTHHKIPSKVAQTDLNLWVMEADGGLELELEYYTDLFKADTIKRMMKHLEVLLGGILADPDKRIGDLPILTKEELKQLEEWNTTHADYPREACVQQLFEDQVEKTPENGAVVYEGSQLTYLELNQRANRLAHYLRELGVGPDVPVGIYMDRCGEMFVALFGVLKAGGAYVPLDPEYPKERLTYMMEDAQLGVILTQERLRDEIPANSARVVFLDGDWQNISQYSDIDPPRLTKPGNLMYVIYTSGSTGKPKGVEVPHGAVVNFLLSMAERPGFVQQDVLLAVTTLSFDIHVLELYLPLMVGAKTVILSREAAGDGMTLLKTLQNSGATVMQATPATWRLLLSAGWKESADLKVLCGGEAFPPDLAMELVKRAGSVWNMYGPTETTVWSTCYEYKDGDAPIPIGRPIANTTVYILDKHQQPVPVGVPGELYIGGAGVARGYRNRSDLTKERFIADPFSQDQKARLYKTGDLARYRSDGNLEYLNRMDNQVKVRGFRIELGEIETALGEVDAVKQGVVIAREIKPGDTRLIAYFIPVGGKSLTPTDLRSHLRKKLPEYMIPQHFVELDKMPLTPAGKIDRKGLPSPWGSQGGAEPEYVPPRNEAERILASIWQEVLGIDRVSAHDNFFDLGGHSLLCIQVIERIIKETGIRLSPRTILLNNLSQIGQELKASLPPKETFAKKEAEKNGADSSPGGFLRKMKKKFFPHSH
jgi:amino acid adenylation domain-containing protein